MIVDEDFLKWLNKTHFTKKLEDKDSFENMVHELQMEVSCVFKYGLFICFKLVTLQCPFSYSIPITHELCTVERMKQVLATLQVCK